MTAVDVRFSCRNASSKCVTVPVAEQAFDKNMMNYAHSAGPNFGGCFSSAASMTWSVMVSKDRLGIVSWQDTYPSYKGVMATVHLDCVFCPPKHSECHSHHRHHGQSTDNLGPMQYFSYLNLKLKFELLAGLFY